MNVRIVRLLERWNEDPCVARFHLVHVVCDLRLVLGVHLYRESRLSLGEHEPIAVVVMADVAVIEVGIGSGVGRALRVVPVIEHQHLAVGVLRRHQQEHRVVQDLLDLGPIVGRHPMRDLDDGLAVSDFGRVDGRIEEVKRHALASQPHRVRFGEASRVGQAMVDFDQPVQPSQILTRAERDEHVGVTQCSFAAFLEYHAVGVVGQVLEVRHHSRVASELAVGADFEAEELLRGLEGLGLSRRSDRQEGDRRQTPDHVRDP